MSFRKLQADVLRWAKDKDLVHEENAEAQFMKFIEEAFEFRYEMERYKRDVGEMKRLSLDKAKVEMGDIFVTLIILCKQLGISPTESLQMAYEKIKNRKGKTIGGNFYKQEDLEGME